MKIKVNLEASEISNTWKFDLDELGYTEQEWLDTSNEEKEKAIKEWVDNLPEQPYWVLSNFTEIE